MGIIYGPARWAGLPATHTVRTVITLIPL